MTDSPAGPVVVGVDGSEESLHAVARAIEEARCKGAELHVVHVNDVAPALLHMKGGNVDTREIVAAHREDMRNEAERLGEGSGVVIQFVGLEGDQAADTLVAYCEESSASLLVIGPRGRGRFTRALLGSTAHNVINNCRRDVLVVHQGT